MKVPGVLLLSILLLVAQGCATTAIVVGDGPGQLPIDSVVRQGRSKPVRVHLTSGRIASGTMLTISADTLTLVGPDRSTFPVPEIAEITIRPSASSYALLGAAAGGLIGAGLVTCEPPACKRFVIGLGTIGGAFMGGIFGPRAAGKRLVFKPRQP